MVKPYPGTGSNEVQWSSAPPPPLLIIQTDSSGICFQIITLSGALSEKMSGVCEKKMAAFTDAERNNETQLSVAELKVFSLESG